MPFGNALGEVVAKVTSVWITELGGGQRRRGTDMTHRVSRVCLWALILLAVSPALGRADEVDDLKTAFEQWVQALNARDLNALSALEHEQLVSIGPNAPFPVDGKPAVQQGFQALFASLESLSVKPINPQFRVIGDTGLVWDLYAFTAKPKDGPLKTSYGRATFVYTKTAGKWLLIERHLSWLPAGN